MKHGSLFSGIGGFDLASEWMGWENVFHCEIAEFPRKILHYYYPNSISYENIKETDFTIHRGRIDILTGGFPCQPFSMAGKRKGTEDERHLWPEMLRAIREILPRYIVGENVFGLVNWDAGLVFEQVQSDLEAEGYEVQAFILPAAAVDAPHRRDRVWFVAYNNKSRFQKTRSEKQTTRFEQYRKLDRITTDTDSRGLGGSKEVGWDSFDVEGKGEFRNVANTDLHGCNQCDCNNEIDTSQGRVDAQRNSESSNVNGDVANTDSKRCTWKRQQGIIRQEGQRREKRFRQLGNIEHQWEKFPTQPPVCGGNDGLPTQLDGITFSKWRNESIKGYGNAIVPQVVLQIFKAIEEYESQR